MPPLPPAPQTIRVRLGGQKSGQPWNHIQFLQFSGTVPTAANLDAVATAVSTAWNANMAPVMDTGVGLTQVECIDISTNMGAAGIDSTVHAGLRTGTQFP